MNFAGNSDYVINMADNILDNLTGGEHSKTVKLIEEVRFNSLVTSHMVCEILQKL